MEANGRRCIVKARPFKNKRICFERIEKFISPIYFSDVNFYSRLYPEKNANPEFLGHFSAGDKRFMKYKEVTTEKFHDVKVGDSFGPTWSSHWFKVKFTIPESWKGQEVRLRWNSGSEAMVWKDGIPMQGLTGGDGQVRKDFILTENAYGKKSFELYIEMAANGMFGAGKDGMINPPDYNRSFTLSMVEIAVFNRKAYKIISDLKILLGIIKQLPDDDQRAWQALYTGNDVTNCFQPETNDSYERATSILDNFFKQSNGESQHTVHAVGHCHIDSAWLWPYDETIRKCARSWSSTIGLMRRYPDFKFACSQAQQFEWVKDHYPALYEELKLFVRKGQFLPVGGTWVEMDGNLPSGESFVRQFLYGQKFFKSEFGTSSNVFWLPDTFGYSAQIPQIMQKCGMQYFVTQKLSWSLINKFPHNTFIWQGIDGTRCLTHFPPADTYESNGGADDVLKSSTNNKDKGLVNDSLLLFGFGDGGGGPTEDMIESLQRMENVDGVPRVKFSEPSIFFDKIEPATEKLSVWVGELYLELHQGTFTTHGMVKKMNRKCEIRLHDTEFVSTMAWIKDKMKPESYPTLKLSSAWKYLMLNQFHDVLPGTSIKEVYDVAIKYYNDILSSTQALSEKALGVLSHHQEISQEHKFPALLNTCSWDRLEVVHVKSNILNKAMGSTQASHEGGSFALVDVPSMGYAEISPKVVSRKDEARIAMEGSFVVLQNGILDAKFNTCGQMISLQLKAGKREVCNPGKPGNQLAIFDDIPLFWDAWDVMPYYRETGRVVDEVTKFSVIDNGPLRVSFEVSIKISEVSNLKQRISLDAESPFVRFVTTVNWHENRKFLRVEFPVDVLSDYASYEIQFGHVRRPTHGNTSWDWAKYEVCGHKWVDLSEHDFGVALLSECKYGYSVTNKTMAISLLRSPKSPDDTADMGSHEFEYAVMPHNGTLQSARIIQHAYNFNNVMQEFIQSKEDKLRSFFQVSSPAVILETVKKAEDMDNAIVLRLYEAYGGKASTVLKTTHNISRVWRCNMLEEPQNKLEWDQSVGCKIELNPFEIITLILELKW